MKSPEISESLKFIEFIEVNEALEISKSSG